VALNQQVGRFCVSDFLNYPYKITYIILRSRDLLEKLTVAQVSNLFSAFYDTLRLINTLSCSEPKYFIPSKPSRNYWNFRFFERLLGVAVAQSEERLSTGWTTDGPEFKSL
jgi:hypothetical protein